MRNLINRSITWITVFSIFILNCSQKTEDFGYLTVQVNGKSWKATKMVPDKYVSEILQIAGTNGNSELWVQIENPEKGRARPLQETDLNHFTDEQHNMFMIVRGSITVTSMDDQWVKGNFEFSANNNRGGTALSGKNGEFKVPNPRRFRK